MKIYALFRGIKHSLLITFFGYSSVCRHQPSCSEYMVTQIKEHGTILGFSKGCIRILRCWSL